MRGCKLFWCCLFLLMILSCQPFETADLVIQNGKIITVDKDFSIEEALAVKGDKIMAVGSGRQIQKLVGDHTRVIDARGKTVIPGLIDAHLHPEQAAFSELDEAIPDLRTIAELLTWIENQAGTKSKGAWIIHPKFFSTRLLDSRLPTLAELDQAAPENPVFLNGSYGGMVNTMAMIQSKMMDHLPHPGVQTDDKTGNPDGFIRRAAFGLLDLPHKSIPEERKVEAILQMLTRYNRYGITSVCSGGGNFELFELYRDLSEKERLTARVSLNIVLPRESGPENEEPVSKIRNMPHKTGMGDEWVRIAALKVFLDGGILTGTALLREPWGPEASSVFGMEDPAYRGVQNYSYSELLRISRAAAANDWKFTAHCTGGGGVDLLLDVYEEVDRSFPLKEKRFSIIHGNFFTPEAIERMAKMGIYADAQAAWFYKDADAMKDLLGKERINTFLPYRSLLDAGVKVNGGSDHMVKFDADRSINPYNPFLAMWSMITRSTERGSVIVPEEAITREEALKMYTIHNAYATFEEDLKGSIEPGKLADFVILSDEILECPAERIRDIRAEMTIVGGQIVYVN